MKTTAKRSGKSPRVSRKSQTATLPNPSAPIGAWVSYQSMQILIWYFTLPVGPAPVPGQPPIPAPPPPPGMEGLTRAQMKTVAHGWIAADCPIDPVWVAV